MFKLRLKSHSIYGLTFFLSLLISVFFILSWDINKTSNFSDQVTDLREEDKVDVCFLGDSIAITANKSESDPRNLVEMFADKSGLTVLPLAHAAYGPVVYRDALRLVRASGHFPRCVILPLSTRHFTRQITANPQRQFRLERLRTKLQFDVDAKSIFNFLYWRFLHQETKSIGEFLSEDVVLMNRKMKRLEVSSFSLRVPLNYKDVVPYIDEMKWHFAHHYLEPVDLYSLSFVAVDQIIQICKQNEATLLVYMNPINRKDAQICLGPSFDQRYEKQIKIIRDFMDERKIVLHDFSDLVHRDEMMHARYVCDHLFEQGRKKVCRELLNLTEKQMLSD